MRSLMTVALVLLMVLPGWACGSGPNTWTDGDRFSNNQSLKGTRTGIAGLDQLRPHLPPNTAVLQVFDATRMALITVETNLAKTEEIHGPPPPELNVDFSPKASEAARTQQAQEHSKKGVLDWILAIGGYLGLAAGIAATVLNAPIVGPWLATTGVGQFVSRVLAGPIVKVATDLTKGIAQARAKAEGQPIGAKELIQTVVANSSPTTAAITDKVSDKIETKLNLELTPLKELATTPS